MVTSDFPPKAGDFHSESDVEQKFIIPFLTLPSPLGLGIPSSAIFSKSDIRKLRLDKGTKEKLYYPDYAIVLQGMPLMIGEVKAPSDMDLPEAAREARLYSTEINSSFPENINPCRYCFVSNGGTIQLRAWDSTEILAECELKDYHASSPNLERIRDLIAYSTLVKAATEMSGKFRPKRFERPLNTIGGTSAREGKIDFNGFGKLLTSRFQNYFNPSSWEDRKRIVRDAYVASKQKERYFGEIDRLIQASQPPKIVEAQLIGDTSTPTEITSRFARPDELKNRVLLLIGPVGSGKSTFVDYLQEIALTENVKDAVAWVRLDLNDAPVSSEEIYKWCRTHLSEGIASTSPDIDLSELKNVKNLYKKELRDFENLQGVLLDHESVEYKTRFIDEISKLRADQDLTLKAMERFLCTGRGRLLIVGLDNCDKRNRDEQLLMFQVAKWIQQEIRCLVIMPIRHETFENHRDQPPLDTALKDLIFRIEPPSFQEVLTRRLDLVLAAAKRDNTGASLSYKIEGGSTVVVSHDKAERFLRTMMRSIFGEKQYGRNIILGLAGRDIRRAFEIFLDFCSSGYVDDREIFKAQALGEHYTLGKAVVARVLLRTNRRFYDGDRSYVKNLFQCDPKLPNPDCFIRYNILSWLRNKKSKAGASGIKGFHRVGDMARGLVANGSSEEEIVKECNYLLRAKCILSEHLKLDVLSMNDLIAITAAGHVHLDLSHGDIHYLAACAEDAWIANPALVQRMSDRITMKPFYNALSYPVTLDSAEDFVKYLTAYRRKKQGHLAKFLDNEDLQIWEIDLDKINQQLEEHYKRLSS